MQRERQEEQAHLHPQFRHRAAHHHIRQPEEGRRGNHQIHRLFMQIIR